MDKLKIQIDFEPIPNKDQNSIQIIFNNLIKEFKNENIVLNGNFKSTNQIFLFNFNIEKYNNIKEIVGPKLTNIDAIAFFQKKYFNCKEKNGKIYAYIDEKPLKERIINVFTNVLDKCSWSSLMKWNNSNIQCVRPIRNISIKLNLEFLSGFYKNLQFSFNENDILSLDDRINIITKELNKKKIIYDYNLIIENAYFLSNPKLIISEFDSKYLKLPYEILSYIIQKEFKCFPIQYSNKIIGFINNNTNINITFSVAINSKLFDILQMYNNSLNKVNHNINEEKIKTMKYFANLLNLDKKFDRLCDIFDFDLNTELVINFPEFKGIITEYFYPNLDIRDAHANTITENGKILKILEILYNLKNLSPPKNDLDPFKVKKQIDYIVNNYNNNYINCLSNDMQTYFFSRLKFNDYRKYIYINFTNLESVLNLNNFYLNKNYIIRIINLKNKSEKNKSIILNDIEKDLLEKITNLNMFNLNLIIEELIKYIDISIINNFIERVEILEKFIEKLKSIINLNLFLDDNLKN